MPTLPPGVRFLQGDPDDPDDDVERAAQQMTDGNPDMDLEIAIEISEDMRRRGVLESYLEGAPEGDDEGLSALAEFRNPGDIRRVDLDGDGVRYENVMLLAPGAWTDAGSRSTAIYSGEGIRASAENWVDPSTGKKVEEAEINFLHGPALHNATSLGDIGTIPTDSIVVDDQDRMYGDLVLHGESSASQASIDLMDEVLESADDPQTQTPPVGPSVEIVDEESEPDAKTGAARLTEMWFSGVGLVFGPASRPVEMEKQARGRAIAMADEHGYDTAGLVLRADQDGDGESSGETVLTGSRHAAGMSKHARDRINKLLEQTQQQFAEMQRVLQEDGDIELVQTLVEQFRQNGGDMEAPATEFLEFIEENADIDAAEIQEVLDSYVEDVGAESLEETPVQGLADWAEEQMGEPDDDDPDDDPAMSQEDLQQAVDTIGSFASELESVKDMLSDYKGDVNDEIATLEDEIEEKERRLSKLEDQPIRQAQEGKSGESFLDENGDGTSAGSEGHEDVML